MAQTEIQGLHLVTETKSESPTGLHAPFVGSGSIAQRGGVSTEFASYRDDVDESHLEIGDKLMAACVSSSMTRNIVRYDKTSSELTDFLNTYCTQVVSDDDNNYNIIDQHGNKKWLVSPQSADRFYSIIEKMRSGKITNGFSARQNGTGRFFIDFDIVLKSEHQISKSASLITTLVKEVATDILADSIKAEGKELKFYALATTRDFVTPSEDKGGYKDGIHLYIDLATHQPFRKYLVNKMVESKKYTKEDLFLDVSEHVINTGSILDKMSASVAPMLLGATKKNAGVNYSPFALYELIHNGTRIRARVLDPNEYSQWNLAAMFNPMHCARGTKLTEINPLPTIARDLESAAANLMERLGDEDSESISMMNVNDPTAREIQSLLDLLGKDRYDLFTDWSKVLLAIAHWGDRYKPIARMFSMRSDKYKSSNFEYYWARAVSAAKKYAGAGIGILVKMAKQDDPAGYKSLMSELLHQKITHYIFEVIGFMDAKSAHLGDYQIADIIHSAFPNKYIAIPKRTNTGRRVSDDSDVSYYSLMMQENADYRPGLACKYTEVFSTAPIQIYISTKVPVILRGVKNFFQKKKDEAEATPSATQNRDVMSYNIALGIIGRAYSACQNHGSKGSIMRQFALIATNHQFEYELDVNPYVMGIYDALLEVGVEPRMLRHAGDHRVTRTSHAKYRIFDPEDKYIIAVTQWIIDFVPRNKFDKFMYLILYLCQAMSAKVKQLGLLNIFGGGQNAKSTILFLMNLALGMISDGGYAYKMGIDYLTQVRTNSSAAQSELMPLQTARYTLLSEAGANQVFVENKLKTLLSGECVAGRENYGNEKNFVPKSIFVYGSNPRVKLESELGRGMRKYAYDWGTLRRCGMMQAECKFTQVPDPEKPNQRKADPRIVNEYIYDPNYQGAFLSLLSMTYAMFMMMHDEQIMYVCSPNVAKETDEWRRSFDTIDSYINAYCVRNEKCECRLEEMVNSYILWHDKVYSPVTHDRDLISQAFIASKMEKYIKPRGNTYWVTGVRFIADSIEELIPGETRFMRSDEYEFKDYTDYKMPDGLQLPFRGKIKPTDDARTFLRDLAALHKSELAEYKLRGKDANDESEHNPIRRPKTVAPVSIVSS